MDEEMDWEACVLELQGRGVLEPNQPQEDQGSRIPEPSNPSGRAQGTLDAFLGRPSKPKSPVRPKAASNQQWNAQKRFPQARPAAVAPAPLEEPVNLKATPPLDIEVAETWVYPANRERREYQYSIVQKALFTNTLVVLPTGLGKTLIAAVVMYNYFRWYPTGKIIFMAPTRPLVGQQIEACHNIMGIAQEDTVELTGSTPPAKRREEWQKRRVFYLTPQILEKDISSGICSTENFVCLVIDEAHRATGNYAYCTVMRQLQAAKVQLRVLALSATPASDHIGIQSLINNLGISAIEYRWDNHPEVAPYTHNRKLDVVPVPLDAKAQEVRSQFLEQVLRPIINHLCRVKVFWNSDFTHVRVMELKTAFDQFKGQFQEMEGKDYSDTMLYFGTAMTLYTAYDLLLTHGLRPAFEMLNSKLQEPRNQLKRLHNMPGNGLPSLMEFMRQKALNGAPHTKLKKTREILSFHFQTHDPAKTRVMIFTNFRESVKDILEYLAPLEQLKPVAFIGQSAGRSIKGQTQKEQQAILQKFRAGEHNVLVATSIGEEGLDIGEVDLVLCFDASGSPLRMVQRMGRTGRKRKGRVVILATEGSEAAKYAKNSKKHQYVSRDLQKVDNFTLHPSSRMLPHCIRPSVNVVHMEIPPWVPKVDKRGAKKKRTDEETAQQSPKKRARKERVTGVEKPKQKRAAKGKAKEEKGRGDPAIEPLSEEEHAVLQRWPDKGWRPSLTASLQLQNTLSITKAIGHTRSCTDLFVGSLVTLLKAQGAESASLEVPKEPDALKPSNKATADPAEGTLTELGDSAHAEGEQEQRPERKKRRLVKVGQKGALQELPLNKVPAGGRRRKKAKRADEAEGFQEQQAEAEGFQEQQAKEALKEEAVLPESEREQALGTTPSNEELIPETPTVTRAQNDQFDCHAKAQEEAEPDRGLFSKQEGAATPVNKGVLGGEILSEFLSDMSVIKATQLPLQDFVPDSEAEEERVQNSPEGSQEVIPETPQSQPEPSSRLRDILTPYLSTHPLLSLAKDAEIQKEDTVLLEIDPLGDPSLACSPETTDRKSLSEAGVPESQPKVFIDLGDESPEAQKDDHQWGLQNERRMDCLAFETVADSKGEVKSPASAPTADSSPGVVARRGPAGSLEEWTPGELVASTAQGPRKLKRLRKGKEKKGVAPAQKSRPKQAPAAEVNPFIDDEAEVSDDDSEDECASEEAEEEDLSFINDATQLSAQPPSTDTPSGPSPLDMMAVYRRSLYTQSPGGAFRQPHFVTSPVLHPCRNTWKLKQQARATVLSPGGSSAAEEESGFEQLPGPMSAGQEAQLWRRGGQTVTPLSKLEPGTEGLHPQAVAPISAPCPSENVAQPSSGHSHMRMHFQAPELPTWQQGCNKPLVENCVHRSIHVGNVAPDNWTASFDAMDAVWDSVDLDMLEASAAAAVAQKDESQVGKVLATPQAAVSFTQKLGSQGRPFQLCSKTGTPEGADNDMPSFDLDIG